MASTPLAYIQEGAAGEKRMAAKSMIYRALIAPFRYTGLLFATSASYVVWGDEPNVLAWCGIALLIGSGIYILRASGPAVENR